MSTLHRDSESSDGLARWAHLNAETEQHESDGQTTADDEDTATKALSEDRLFDMEEEGRVLASLGMDVDIDEILSGEDQTADWTRTKAVKRGG